MDTTVEQKLDVLQTSIGDLKYHINILQSKLKPIMKIESGKEKEEGQIDKSCDCDVVVKLEHLNQNVREQLGQISTLIDLVQLNEPEPTKKPAKFANISIASQTQG